MDSNKMIEETLRIATTPQGYPYFESNRGIRLAVHVSNVHSETSQELELSGNSITLRRLGELLVGLSRCKSYHIHLENNNSSPIVIDGKRIRLTIANTDKADPLIISDSDPPDWAK